MTRFSVIDAPSNLGLRPPEPGVVPGVYKLAGALRDCGLVPRIGAEDDGVVTPPRYLPDYVEGEETRNSDGLARYSVAPADRIGTLIDRGRMPVVLGGDCSILIGCALSLRRRGRYGLAFLDGHSDFRHPGNSEAICAAAGEDLAIVSGRGDDRLINLEGLGPYVADCDIFAAGLRDGDEGMAGMQEYGIEFATAARIRASGTREMAEQIRARVSCAHLDGFWIHLDLDILDAGVMPAVDSPEIDGSYFDELGDLLSDLVGDPKAIGVDITIYDPDLDPDGEHALSITNMLVKALNTVDTG
jgi:arginase